MRHRPRAPASRGGRPLGVVLAGGSGRRIGGSKAVVNLGGRPLLSYPVQAVWEGLENVAIVAKVDTELPSLAGVTVWIEPAVPRHPLVGIAHALELAEGRPVLVCAGDLPFVTPTLVRRLALADPQGAPAVIAARDGVGQPLLGCYQPHALELLAPAAREAQARVTDVVAAIGPRLYEVEDPDALFNINSPDDLLLASAMLDRRRPRATRT